MDRLWVRGLDNVHKKLLIQTAACNLALWMRGVVRSRQAAEAYILSQREQGWEVVAERYDDGGFSGGNRDRPALKRLLKDLAARWIDCVVVYVVVYKVDRLSRSLVGPGPTSALVAN